MTSLWFPTRARNFVREFLPTVRPTKFTANMAALAGLIGLESITDMNPIVFCYKATGRHGSKTAERLLGRITYRALLKDSVRDADYALVRLLKAQDEAVGREDKITTALCVFEKTIERLVLAHEPSIAAAALAKLTLFCEEQPEAFAQIQAEMYEITRLY